MARVLVVEDQPDIGEMLSAALNDEGLETRLVSDGREVVTMVRSWNPDLIVLDLMLPGMDGYEVLRQVRAQHDHLPVIILSARVEESDKIRGFRLDADQYVTKPFSLVELLERIHALIRRSRSQQDPPTEDLIRFGQITVEVSARKVTKADTPVSLSPKAFDLLLALIRSDGAVASRARLLGEVWGYKALVLSRTVDSHVAELRRKLEENPGKPEHIITVYKVGYRFQA